VEAAGDGLLTWKRMDHFASKVLRSASWKRRNRWAAVGRDGTLRPSGGVFVSVVDRVILLLVAAACRESDDPAGQQDCAIEQ